MIALADKIYLRNRHKNNDQSEHPTRLEDCILKLRVRREQNKKAAR